MKKYLSELDYRFIIIAVLTVIVLAGGVFSIDYVLNRPPEMPDDDMVSPTSPIYKDEINLLDEADDFKKYYISVQDINFSASVEDVILDIREDSIDINEVEVLAGAYPTKYISFYGDYLIVPFIYNDNWYGGILIYDTTDGSSEVIDKIDNKYIINDMENFISSKDGIMLNTSMVNGNDIIIDGDIEDVCTVKKSKKMKVSANIFLKYDSKKKRIATSKYEEISSISLDAYRETNNLC